MKRNNAISLCRKIQLKRQLHLLCGQAIAQQIEHGHKEVTNMRSRRRHMARQVLKLIPKSSRNNPRTLLHAAMMVLAMWGFAGLSMPTTSEAATVFVSDVTNNPLAFVDVEPRLGLAYQGHAAPTFVDIDGDGDLDAFIGRDVTGTVLFYRNNGTASSPSFVADTVGNPLSMVAGSAGPLSGVTPTFADIDGDGDLDAFVGGLSSFINFYRNDDISGNGTAPAFVADAVGNPMAGIRVGKWFYEFDSAPVFTDIDADGDLDAIVGDRYGEVFLYTNSGTATAPIFTANAYTNLLPLPSNTIYETSPALMDVDADGDLDLFVGEIGGSVHFFRNTGTATTPVFTLDGPGNPMAPGGVYFYPGNMAKPSFADIDADGDLDLFVGETTGTVVFYRNINPTPTPKPDTLNAPFAVASTTGDVKANDLFTVEGPAATFTITAFDALSVNGGTVVNNGNNTFTYTSAAAFSGADSFTYTLDNGAGITAVGTVQVNVIPAVIDISPPVVTPPPNIIMEATGPTTPATLGMATVVDNIDIGLSATPDISGPFSVGVHTITWTATDNAGNTGTAVQTVSINDTTAPVISLSGVAVVTIEAGTGYVDAGASFSDLVDGPGAVSGTGFVDMATPGGYTVTFNYTDTAGNAATPVIRTVNVVDTTAPIITAPPSAAVIATSAAGIDTTQINVSNFLNGPVATDNVAVVSITHNAPAMLPVGVTVVTFTASDAAGNSSTATAQITVAPYLGIFIADVKYTAGSYPVCVRSGDFNGDGSLDLAVANYLSNNVGIQTGKGDGTFNEAIYFPIGLHPIANSIAIGDYNGDGNLDLAVISGLASDLKILTGNGDATFNLYYPVAFNGGGVSSGIRTGDFNGDGKLDLVVVKTWRNEVSVLTGNGDGTFNAASNYPVGVSPIDITIGDFNGDGKLDLAVANRSTNYVSVLIGTGSGAFAAASIYPTGFSPVSITSGDYNGDGKLDLAYANSASNGISVLTGKGDGTFNGFSWHPANGNPVAIISGDYNSDGKLDLIVANGLANNVSVLVGNGDETFNTPDGYPAGANPVSVASGDFDGDGSLDLAVANYSSNNVSVLMNRISPVIEQAVRGGGGGGCMKPSGAFNLIFAIIIALMAGFNLCKKLNRKTYE